MTKLTVIILAKDEALHIRRAITSVKEIATDILIVDSGSSDETVAIARAEGARVLTHAWVNYADQFNWALTQIRGQGGWVMRLDADEIVTPELCAEIATGLPDAAGVTVGRSMCFQGAPVKHGGLFPIKVLRLFRNGKGLCESRWMDEHIVVRGPIAEFSGQIIDDNRKSLDWWTAKHNSYASREVIDILNQDLQFLPQHTLRAEATGRQAAVKRWLKTRAYARLPLGLRAGVYFLYRYFVRGGWRDVPRAREFHVLQGFWYRYLVDSKLAEVRKFIADHQCPPTEAIKTVLGIDVTRLQPSREEAAA